MHATTTHPTASLFQGKSQLEAEALITEMRSEQRWFVEAYSATLTKNLELGTDHISIFVVSMEERDDTCS